MSWTRMHRTINGSEIRRGWPAFFRPCRIDFSSLSEAEETHGAVAGEGDLLTGGGQGDGLGTLPGGSGDGVGIFEGVGLAGDSLDGYFEAAVGEANEFEARAFSGRSGGAFGEVGLAV